MFTLTQVGASGEPLDLGTFRSRCCRGASASAVRGGLTGGGSLPSQQSRHADGIEAVEHGLENELGRQAPKEEVAIIP